jgi:hypothetical protein
MLDKKDKAFLRGFTPQPMAGTFKERKMHLNELISHLSRSPRMRCGGGQTFDDSHGSVCESQSKVSVEGYMKKAETDGFVLFSESLLWKPWIRIPVQKIHALEYFGPKFITHEVCAKVRLTL